MYRRFCPFCGCVDCVGTDDFGTMRRCRWFDPLRGGCAVLSIAASLQQIAEAAQSLTDTDHDEE